ncbi:MAG TPA: glycoside hydrolase family 30 beta sandwich domain-containing protein [Acidimicrobiales bacterium]|nr:glycoside hydrolase family 30 beta sandwich domain-containing protein [Acidimicrobiales bacterium]
MGRAHAAHRGGPSRGRRRRDLEHGTRPGRRPQEGGCQNCRGVVTVDTTTGAVTYNVEYYVLGHASRFVVPGAAHLTSTDDGGDRAGLEHVAFRNPDGTHALIVLNSAGEPRTFGVRCSDASFGYRLPAGAVATFTWG